jgi:LPS O-antigen subunit length determinant protein (WzzB/FepE family)
MGRRISDATDSGVKMQYNSNVKINNEEINPLSLLIPILKRKRMIIGITLACAIATTIISLIMPPIYRAETSILPPSSRFGYLFSGVKPAWWIIKS